MHSSQTYLDWADSLMLDHVNKKEIDSMTTLCLDQIKLIQETHGTNISDIRSQAEKCLVKDYLVLSLT